jgi:hypothetical protein
MATSELKAEGPALDVTQLHTSTEKVTTAVIDSPKGTATDITVRPPALTYVYTSQSLTKSDDSGLQGHNHAEEGQARRD